MPMTGCKIYKEACKPELLRNEEFKLGLEMPHFSEKLKRHGIEGAREFYNSIKTDNMPKFERFTERLSEPERPEESSGMHYGTQQNPDIMYLWETCTEKERRDPFWRGYTWHLLVDHVIYQECDERTLENSSLRGEKLKENPLQKKMEYLKKFNPLEGDLENIIQEVLWKKA